MNQLSRVLVLAGLVVPGTLVAQLPGIAHRNAGVTRGLQLAAEVGFPNAASIDGAAFGGTAAFGVGLIGFTASVTTWQADWGISPDPSREYALGATGNYRLLGGPLVPLAVTLQAGVGRWTESAPLGDIMAEQTTTSVPVGLGFALTIPSPIVSFKPWLAPRLQWTDRSEFGSTSDFAIGGGIDLGFINGTSIRGAYDRVFTDGQDRSVWSVGLAHSLGVGR
jgi:hypothetical protein